MQPSAQPEGWAQQLSLIFTSVEQKEVSNYHKQSTPRKREKRMSKSPHAPIENHVINQSWLTFFNLLAVLCKAGLLAICWARRLFLAEACCWEAKLALTCWTVGGCFMDWSLVKLKVRIQVIHIRSSSYLKGLIGLLAYELAIKRNKENSTSNTYNISTQNEFKDMVWNESIKRLHKWKNEEKSMM